MEILKAKCPQCGAFYYGWALEDPLKRKCIKCDSQMEITENVEAAEVFEKQVHCPQVGKRNSSNLNIISGA
jgi:endogenous inhibitor of DNA gyrase (YacG/DUF329 family)